MINDLFPESLQSFDNINAFSEMNEQVTDTDLLGLSEGGSE
jgi:hypothetical protein